MASSVLEVLEVQGRGITGALLVVGLATLTTMETWWIGRTIPTGHLLAYAAGGLLVVFLVTRRVGFREARDRTSLSETVVDFSELVVQSLAAAALSLTAFGVLDPGTAPITAVRLVLVQAVPLSFGASLASALLEHEDGEGTSEAAFPNNLPTFALGAAFVTFPIAPTDEVVVIAVQAGAARLAALIVLSVAVVHLVLHEVGYRDQDRRVADRSARYQLGLAFVVYAVGLVVSAGLLVGFGQTGETTAYGVVQRVVVLGFPAAVGASGAEVVL